jgi:hypothetical protein
VENQGFVRVVPKEVAVVLEKLDHVNPRLRKDEREDMEDINSLFSKKWNKKWKNK